MISCEHLAGWGLTQNDIASFVGWSPQPSAVGPVPHQPGFLINFSPLRRQTIKNGVEQGHGTQPNRSTMKDLWPSASRFWKDQARLRNGQQPSREGVPGGLGQSFGFPLPPLKFRTAGFPQYGFKWTVNGDLRRCPKA